MPGFTLARRVRIQVGPADGFGVGKRVPPGLALRQLQELSARGIWRGLQPCQRAAGAVDAGSGLCVLLARGGGRRCVWAAASGLERGTGGGALERWRHSAAADGAVGWARPTHQIAAMRCLDTEMQLRPKNVSIPPENPFGFDLLGRKPVAEALTELAKSSPEGLVLSLHAPWGGGKSTFLQMWRQQLQIDGFKTLYFNAWESDFTDDALVALIGELEAGVSLLRDMGTKENPSHVAASINKAKKIGATLLRRSLPVALKVGTAGILDVDQFSEKALSDFAEKTAEAQIKAYEESRKSIGKFRDAIAEVAKDLSQPDEGGATLPLILIVDELDRCRPPYAVRILECIKHLFAVPKVVFVVAIDKTQLAHSVRSQYGAEMDAHGYLRRFFDIELTLPDPGGQAFSNSLFDRFGLTAGFAERGKVPGLRNEKSQFEEILPHLFKILSCTLRERERVFALLSFAVKITPANKYLFPFCLAALIVLKIKESTLYAEISSGRKNVEAVLRLIGDGVEGKAFLNSRLGLFFEAELTACMSTEDEFDRIRQNLSVQISGAAPANPTRAKDPASRTRLERLHGIYSDSDIRKIVDTLDYLRDKIDLVAPSMD